MAFVRFIVAYVLFPGVSYLVGSISFGLIVAKLRGVDLRSQGSGNVGATNVVRVLGMKAGAVVFALDVLKGFVPALVFALIARAIVGAQHAPSWKILGIVYGACAIYGHVFPAFHDLRGGKAVATSCGVFLALAPLQLLTALAIWACVLMFSKYVSVASMAAAVSFFLMVISPLYPSEAGKTVLSFLYPIPEGMGGKEKLLMALFAFLAMAVVLWRHRANIMRLREGTEPKIMTSRQDIRAAEAAKKYGKDRLRTAGRMRRPRTRSTSRLREMSRKKTEPQPAEETSEQTDTQTDSQVDTEAPLEEVEDISADLVEEGEDTDTAETRDASEALGEADEKPDRAREEGNEKEEHAEDSESGADGLDREEPR